jgi:hypothetical protein
VKLHSGRKADSRDLVVLATSADFDRIATHLHRGTLNKLVGRIETVLGRLTSEDFSDAFKGVFEQQTVPERDIDAVVNFLRDQQHRIDAKE